MRFCLFLLLSAGLFSQPAAITVEAPDRTLPANVADKHSATDRVLFGKLMRVGLEAAWSAVTQEGYPLCFINELTPLNGDRRLVGRARTARRASAHAGRRRRTPRATARRTTVASGCRRRPACTDTA